ncbi:carboxylating nicotinate-nucleotide diphosphorylase [Candidatus Desulfovibrio trichonymphae]|uniref:nicotinate-nucleotide diphosphorylase (carboxylating) n=1 Tax=Candidatus Desulfovibrio trichonymphae TaxID=1725232 RepID=A0A1J1DV87_9BACT|nr:carboxylating nicotinate-nucleotide diphosphorylase [Candidatus Desulfovibrio trichonymphae]BAV91756.1 nicotinate-nucleotide pyrophosphorylase [Candidatus Desulfovibrio trichonymphae]GHU93975.1 nicotinate-nucleotide diphosphorylase (carboxylating) [Deltaproteobacteria bacterium]
MFTPWASFFSPEGKTLLWQSIDLALAEDGPDLTAEALFPADTRLHTVIHAKEDSLLVGLPVIGAVFKRLGASFRWRALAPEGSRVPAMTRVAHITAPATNMLRAERVILNYISRLSGIANLTARFVRELDGTGTRLLDTRKTTPGLRWPEKYAVQAGGGVNHRKNLAEMLMLKDNHIDAAGSITQAVALLRARYSPCPPVEVECRTLEHVREAVAARAQRIMMDNMPGELLPQALALVPETIETEVSGGVTIENIRALALIKPRRPDFISVGRLTHSAAAADFSMTLVASERPHRRNAATNNTYVRRFCRQGNDKDDGERTFG